MNASQFLGNQENIYTCVWRLQTYLLTFHASYLILICDGARLSFLLIKK